MSILLRYRNTIHTRLRSAVPLAVLLAGAIPAQAWALAITSQTALNVADEVDASGNVLRSVTASTPASPADARITLGDGTTAFNQPAFAQAFSTFQNGTAVFWVDLNADNSLSRAGGGRGTTTLHLNYTAIKQPGDTSFTLHVSGGSLELLDPGAGRNSLDARIDLRATIMPSNDLTDVLSAARAFADLSGNGGTRLLNTFDVQASGFDLQTGDFILIDDNGGIGNNVVGANLRLPPTTLSANLANIVDGTALNIDVFLLGSVSAPGGETEAAAFLRDPTHVGDADPLAGASTITFDTAAPTPGGPAAVAEPPGWTVFGAALLSAFALRRRRGRHRCRRGHLMAT